MAAARPNRWKGLCLGVVGGALGLAAMSAYWKAVVILSPSNPLEQEATPSGGPLDSISLVGQQRQPDEDSTEAAGRIIYRQLTGGPPRAKSTRSLLGLAVHYGFGLTMGGLFGALRGRQSWPDTAGGLAFGTLLWLSAHELAVPLLGLDEGPTARPAAMHGHELGSHLAYGLATAGAVQALWRLL